MNQENGLDMTLARRPLQSWVHPAIVAAALFAGCGMPTRPVTPQKSTSVANANLNSGLFSVSDVIDDDGKPKYVCTKASPDESEDAEAKLFTCTSAEVEAYRYERNALPSAAEARIRIEEAFRNHLCREATQDDVDANLDAVMKDGLKAEGIAVDLRWSDEGLSKGLNDFSKTCGPEATTQGADLMNQDGDSEFPNPENPSSLIGKPCSQTSDSLTRTTATESTSLGCFFDPGSSSSFSYGLLWSIPHGTGVGQACGTAFPAQRDRKHDKSLAIGCFQNGSTGLYEWQFVTETTKDAPVFGDSPEQANLTVNETGLGDDPTKEQSSPEAISTLCIILSAATMSSLHAQPAAQEECKGICSEMALKQPVGCSWEGQEILP